MNAFAHLVADTEPAMLPARRIVRAQPIGRDTFRAWLGSGNEIDVSAATTLDEARDLTAPHSAHKCQFWVEHSRADARRFLYVYGVTKSTKKGVWRENRESKYLNRVFEGNLEPKQLGAMQILAPFEPVAPWQWSADDYSGTKHGRCPDLLRSEGIDPRVIGGA